MQKVKQKIAKNYRLIELITKSVYSVPGNQKPEQTYEN